MKGIDTVFFLIFNGSRRLTETTTVLVLYHTYSTSHVMSRATTTTALRPIDTNRVYTVSSDCLKDANTSYMYTFLLRPPEKV